MAFGFPYLKPAKKKEVKEDPAKAVRRDLSIAKSVSSVAKDVIKGDPSKAFHNAIISGIKLADGGLYYNPNVAVRDLLEKLKSDFGLKFLTLEPETLFGEIDRLQGWSRERMNVALDHFTDTGEIDSEIPIIVRNKIFALRVVCTSDSAYESWEVFEKVGGAFNDRAAQFDTLEPLSAFECAKTIALLWSISADKFSNEVLGYVAACCYESGLYSTTPSHWLYVCDAQLSAIILSEQGALDSELIKNTQIRYNDLKAGASLTEENQHDAAWMQATKLRSIDLTVDEAIDEHIPKTF